AARDPGIRRTGRHAGDWEVVQYAVRDGVLIRGVYSQHRGAERCPAPAIRTTARGRPLVFLAHGSHAAYFVPGVRDRMWPDPNDEADGRGLRVTPRVEPLGSRGRGPGRWGGDPGGGGARVRWPGRWGGARAGWVPGEMDSPRGPAFQPQGRWSDPEGWARRARPCTQRRCNEVGECDTGETVVALALPAAVLLILVGALR